MSLVGRLADRFPGLSLGSATGVVGVHAELVDVSEVAGRPTATVLVEGESQLGGERMVALCTASEKHLVSLFLSTTVSLPVNELRAELLGAAQTLERPL